MGIEVEVKAERKPSPFYGPAKRLFDLTVALFLLAVTLPVFAVVAFLIKREDGGPILYGGSRIGKGGRPFKILKFRTMVLNADKLGPAITTGDDRRITRVGRVLRATKLDELPQLVNVLKGEMSLVGPRPEAPVYVALYTAEQRRVLSVPPGITGLAAIGYRHEARLLKEATLADVYEREIMPAKLKLDLEYIRRRSFLYDLELLARTALALFAKG
jgi:lipopolysaccharide/colanic/teichoic acid biosynthesis glycosyltransferase